MFPAAVTAVDTTANVGLKGAWTTAAPRTVSVAGHFGVPVGAKAVVLSLSALGGSSADTLKLTSHGTVAGVSFRPLLLAQDTVVVPLRADGRVDFVTASIGTGLTVRVLGFVS